MMPGTDRRTELLAQVLSGIQVLKAYCWDSAYRERLFEAREVELSVLGTILSVRALMRTMLFVMPTIVPFVTLAAYQALGHDLTIEVTFVTFSFISILRFPLLLIPHAFSLFYEAKVSINRIEAFLALPESPNCDPAAALSTRKVEDSSKDLDTRCMKVGGDPTSGSSSISVAGGVGEGTSDQVKQEGSTALKFEWEGAWRCAGSKDDAADAAKDLKQKDANSPTTQSSDGDAQQGEKGEHLLAVGPTSLTIAPGVHIVEGTVRVFRQKFTLEGAIGSHACSLEANMLEANMRVTTMAFSLGSSLLPVDA
jgi:ABC-type multidrug transport system fused ATPase/permease subunit